jgi:transposase InsO family protein
VSVLEKALAQNIPKIFNTDQGSQYTSLAFTGRLEEKGIAVSQDGKGRVRRTHEKGQTIEEPDEAKVSSPVLKTSGCREIVA